MVQEMLESMVAMTGELEKWGISYYRMLDRGADTCMCRSD